MIVACWVSWEADSEIKISTQKFINECSWDQHLWKEREGVQLNRERSLQKRSQLTSRGVLKLVWLLRIGSLIEYGVPWEGAMASGKMTLQWR